MCREQLASHGNLVSFCERITTKYFAAHVPVAGELPPLPEVVGGPKPAEKEGDGAFPPRAVLLQPQKCFCQLTWNGFVRRVVFCPAEEKPGVKATAEEEEQWAESKCWLGGVAALLLSYAVLSVDWLGDWDDWDDDDED